MFNSIISAETLAENYNRNDWIVIDCRYDLGASLAGHQSYQQAHISGAIYADVHKDLSGEPLTDHGRHPLPSAESLRGLFSRFGISEGKKVVAYDASYGAFAARLWWLLRYMGHEEVGVLNGGWQAWQAMGLAEEAGENKPVSGNFQGMPRGEWLVVIDAVLSSALLIDSREAQRYRGEVEPIDAHAGHIPGAINRCWKENLTENGFFLDPAQLKQHFEQIYALTSAAEVVYYCGSGVTACHNLLAAAHAGLAPAKLYAGSWSEWCTQPDRPIAIGSGPG